MLTPYSLRYYAEKVIDARSIGDLIDTAHVLGRAVLNTEEATNGDRADAEVIVDVLGSNYSRSKDINRALELAADLASRIYAEGAIVYGAAS